MLSALALPFGVWTSTMVSVVVVSAVPLLVTFLMARREATLRRWLPQLTALGSGTVFAAAVGHLIPESLRAGQALGTVALGVGAGYVVFALIERALAQHDHAHAHGVPLGAPSAHDSESSEAECVHLHPTPTSRPSLRSRRALAPMALFGDAVHNFVDGALIAAGFLTQPSIGMLTLMAVALHELPRELGTFGLLVHGGIHPMRAVMYNLITAVVAVLGAAITLAAGPHMADITKLLLPFAAGTFLYVAQAVGRAALRDRHGQSVHWGRAVWIGAGALLVLTFAVKG